jgi:NAD(P)-dependent dehydrogenase (short-subunit alcohol dehydrogenase family)
MSKLQAIREIVETALQLSGRIDVLVNNAGIQAHPVLRAANRKQLHVSGAPAVVRAPTLTKV